VKEALFCLAFEGHAKQFAHLEGVRRMRDQCSHVSKKHLALLSKEGRSNAVSRHHKHNSTSSRPLPAAAPQQTGQHDERSDKKVKEHESLIMVQKSKHQSAPSFLQVGDHAGKLDPEVSLAKDMVVDSDEDTEVAEIKRAVIRALTQL